MKFLLTLSLLVSTSLFAKGHHSQVLVPIPEKACFINILRPTLFPMKKIESRYTDYYYYSGVNHQETLNARGIAIVKPGPVEMRDKEGNYRRFSSVIIRMLNDDEYVVMMTKEDVDKLLDKCN